MDDASKSDVDRSLAYSYPPKSVCRLAQWQIKLLLYERQRLRVLGVLEVWEVAVISQWEQRPRPDGKSLLASPSFLPWC